MRSDLFGPPPVLGSKWVDDHLRVIRKAGHEWDCLCPYHEDSSPSFRVNIKKGVWFCHTCHIGGTINKLATDLDLPANFVFGSHHDDYERPLEVEYETRDEAYLKRYECSPTSLGWKFWRSRGFSPSSIKRYDLGFDSYDLVATYPLRRDDGQVLGVVQRRLDGEKPKYKYPFRLDVSKFIFGLYECPRLTERVVIVEGAIDAMLLWQEGIPAIALYGSHAHEEQADKIRGLGAKSYILAFDNDKAGKDGARRLFDLDPFDGAAVFAIDWPSQFNDIGDLANVISLRGNAIKDVVSNKLIEVWSRSDLP